MSHADQSTELKEIVKQSKLASFQMAMLSDDKKNSILADFASLIAKHRTNLLEANAEDLTAAKDKISPAMYQRLILNNDKISQLVRGVEDTASLPDPCHKILSTRQLDKNLKLTQVSTPIGLIAIIFESRPDVIPQVLSLMIKSGNACLLKGGKEALRTNQAFMQIIKELGAMHADLPKHWAHLVETRDQVHGLLAFHNEIDLVIPRGSNELIQSVMSNTKIPVMGHADGVCHIFVDAFTGAGSPQTLFTDQALAVILDAKTQYPSACNSVETLLIHDDLVSLGFLKPLFQKLKEHSVQVFGCEKTCKLEPSCRPVGDWHTEYGDLRIAVRIVSSIEQAIQHINIHGSHHSDAILSQNKKHIELFKAQVDSASVMINASTRFADGYRYGMGAEVGISTNKTHARGPVGLEGLVIYKYILEGDGHTVSKYAGPMK